MKAEGWLILKAKRSSYGKYPSGHPYEGQQRIDSVRTSRVTVSKPAQLDADEIAVKIDFDVDEGWFLNGVATIQATIPAPPQQSQAIAANVQLPVKPKGPSPAAAVIKNSQRP